MFPPFTPSPAAAARRDKLLKALGDRPALVSAGRPIGRNYPGNPYPFRASSHFVYLLGDAGMNLPGCHLWLDGGEATLFAHPPDPADALWHGPTPELGMLGDMLGLKVRPLHELAATVRGRDAASLPGPDAATREEQGRLLGRHPAVDDPVDAALVDALIALRLVHDDAAVAGLKEAAEATRAAHVAGMAATRPGRKELELRAVMEGVFLARGMGTAYGPIVTVHGEVLHNHAYFHTLQEGDLLLADVGAETAGGWAGDVTRTWPVTGSFSTTQRELYEVVLASQLAAIEKVRPGVRYRDVHLEACRKLTEGLVALGILEGDVDELVADDVHALFFPHGVGHLIGLDVHDMEDLGDRAGYAPGRTRSERFGLGYLRLDRDLEPGMAVTIEPGFYQVPAILDDEAFLAKARGRLNQARLAHFADVRGIRIEDDVLVTSGAPEVLTAAIPKTVADVESAIRG